MTGLSWCRDDHKMSSCGLEGAVYEWQLSTTKRVAETIIKSCGFHDVALTTDARCTFAVGTDGHIRELMSSAVHRNVLLTKGNIEAMALSNSDNMLFVCGNNGVTYSVRMPLLDSGVEYIDYIVHNHKVTRVRYKLAKYIQNSKDTRA